MITSLRIFIPALFFIGTSLTFNSFAADKTVIVSAAASLKDSFIEAGHEFERNHPGTKVVFNFSSSNQLAGQIEQGAPVDVFASADLSHIKRLTNKSLVADYALLAKNKLTLIVSKKTKIKIDTIGDLSNKGLRLIMTAKQVPIASYTRQFLKSVDQAGLYGADYGSRVLANTISEEPDVRMAVMKVAMGDGDAGIVYVSDVTGDMKNKVKIIPIEDQFNVVAEYGLALIKNSANSETAKALYNYLLSPNGQAVIVKTGLLPAQSK